MGHRSFQPWQQLLVLMGCWLLIAALINPFGVGPLDDDWAYAWSVQNFLATGHFLLSDWTATNLLPQVLWGSLVSKLLGFSFDALRISTIAAALGGLITTWAMLRQLGASSALALFGTAVVGFNPIFLALSFRFMSDIPSYGLWTASLWAFSRSLKHPNRVNFIIACILGALAILNRQSSAVIFAAYAGAELLRPRLRSVSLMRALLALMVALIVYLGFGAWLATQQELPALYGNQINILVSTIAGSPLRAVSNIVSNLIRSSMFQIAATLLPFSMMLAPPLRWPSSSRDRLVLVTFLAISILAAVIAISPAGYLPGPGQIWKLLAIAPASFEMPPPPLAVYRIVKIVVTLCSLAGVLIWIPSLVMLIRGLAASHQSVHRLCRDQSVQTTQFLVLAGLLYALPILALDTPLVFDRYLLPLLPLVMGILVLSMRMTAPQGFKLQSPWTNSGSLRQRHIIACVMMILTVLYSTAINHDYMAIYRARDMAIVRLAPVVHVSHVDAGWELRGWHNGANDLDACNPLLGKKGGSNSVAWGDFDCLWNPPKGSRHMLRTFPEPGYDIIGRVPVDRWLAPSRYILFILERKL